MSMNPKDRLLQKRKMMAEAAAKVTEAEEVQESIKEKEDFS